MYAYGFKVLFFVSLVLVALYYAGGAFRSARSLDDRIRELKKDQEERKKRGEVTNPYAELAELYKEQETGARK